jgi:hypothetical protein
MRPPPGYPFAGDLPSRPLPTSKTDAETQRRASSLGLVAFAGAMMGAGFMLVALVTAEARHAQLAQESVHMSLAPSASSAEEAPEIVDTPSRVVDSPAPLPPPIERNVPVFPARFLEGCSAHDLDAIEHGLSTAIGRGAPLYNDGDIVACADIYESAARDLEAALPASCGGPVHALADGRGTAGKLASPNARAWAMRDAFDGLIEIMERSRSGGVTNL